MLVADLLYIHLSSHAMVLLGSSIPSLLHERSFFTHSSSFFSNNSFALFSNASIITVATFGTTACVNAA